MLAYMRCQKDYSTEVSSSAEQLLDRKHADQPTFLHHHFCNRNRIKTSSSWKESEEKPIKSVLTFLEAFEQIFHLLLLPSA